MNRPQPSPVFSRPLIAALVAGCAFASTGLPVWAQDSEVAALRQQINELNARLQKLEEAQKTAATTPTATPALAPTVQSGSKTPIVISGLLQAQGNAYFNQDNVPTGSNRLADTGRLRRGEVKISAPAITPRISGTVMFDLAKTNNLNRSGSPLQDLVLAYKLGNNANAPKRIEVGQFKPGFGFESDLVGSAELPFTERAQIYSFRDLAVLANNPLLPGLPGGGLGDNRDIGARFSGFFNKSGLNYNFGLFNGIGEDQNDVARGDVKALVARVFHGRRNARNALAGNVFGVSGLTANNRNENAGGALRRNGYNFFAGHLRNPERHDWRHDRFSYYGEYAVLNSELKNTPGTFKNGIGYYGTLGYLLNPHLELVGRYDHLKQEVTAGTGVSTELAGGFNYYFRDYTAQGPKIQLNLVRVNGEPNALSAFDSFQLRSQFQAAF